MLGAIPVTTRNGTLADQAVEKGGVVQNDFGARNLAQTSRRTSRTRQSQFVNALSSGCCGESGVPRGGPG